LEDYSILSPTTDEGDESIKTVDSGFEENQHVAWSELRRCGHSSGPILVLRFLMVLRLLTWDNIVTWSID